MNSPLSAKIVAYTSCFASNASRMHSLNSHDVAELSSFDSRHRGLRREGTSAIFRTSTRRRSTALVRFTGKDRSSSSPFRKDVAWYVDDGIRGQRTVLYHLMKEDMACNGS